MHKLGGTSAPKVGLYFTSADGAYHSQLWTDEKGFYHGSLGGVGGRWTVEAAVDGERHTRIPRRAGQNRTRTLFRPLRRSDRGWIRKDFASGRKVSRFERSDRPTGRGARRIKRFDPGNGRWVSPCERFDR
jgi:hypothetical protein